MKNSRHIIEKVFLEVNTSKLKTAQDIKDNISELLANELFPRLELLFDEYDKTETVVRFNQLNISLSMADGKNFAEVNYKIIKELNEKLESQMQNVNIERKQSNRDGVNDQLNIQPIHSSGNNQQVFLFFLQHGYLPWYGAEEQIDEATKPEYWNESLRNEEFVNNLKKVISTDDGASERFSLQFSAEIIWSFMMRIQPEYKKFEKEITHFISIADVATNHYFMLFVLSVFRVRERSQIYNSYQQLYYQLKKSSSFFNRKPTMQITKATLQFIQTILPEELRLKSEAKELTGFLKAGNKWGEKSGSPALSHGLTDDSGRSLSGEKDAEVTEEAFQFFTSQEKEIAVQNAGLILLHPFLKSFFIQTGLANKQGILLKDKVIQAVQALHFLATGNESFFEGKLVLEKFMCGFPLKRPIAKHNLLSEEIKAESEVLLKEVIRHWAALKNSSLNDLRHLFIQRNGKLIQKEKEIKLIVEQKTQDILLEKLNWNISIVKLPWKKELLYVEW